MFERTRDGWSLAWLDGMEGRLASAAGVADLRQLEHAAKRTGRAHRIALDDEARGKVVVGDTTFLFQLVAPPAVQGRPQLPLAVKSGSANRIDWSLTVLVGLSFLLHFGFVGALYSDWMDPIADDEATAAFVMTPSTSAVPPAVETADTATATASGTATVADAEHAPATPAPKPSSPSASRPNAPDPAAVDSLLKEVNQIGISTIGVIGTGAHIAGVLTDSNGAPVNLNAYAERSDGVTPGSDLHIPTTDLPINPGNPTTVHFGDPTAPVATTAGTVQKFAPKLTVNDEGVTPTVPVANAEAVIRKYLNPQARRCYMRGLDDNPTMSGRLVLVIRVAPNGEVSSVSIESNSGLTGRVPGCISGAAQGLKFDAPGGVGSILRVPIGLYTQPGAAGG
jgi:hypothetical protein